MADRNVRSLAAVMKIARDIIKSGKDKEFIEQCSKNDDLFVVSTDASREFIATFLKDNEINPAKGKMHGFEYAKAGFPTCT